MMIWADPIMSLYRYGKQQKYCCNECGASIKQDPSYCLGDYLVCCEGCSKKIQERIVEAMPWNIMIGIKKADSNNGGEG